MGQIQANHKATLDKQAVKGPALPQKRQRKRIDRR